MFTLFAKTLKEVNCLIQEHILDYVKSERDGTVIFYGEDSNGRRNAVKESRIPKYCEHPLNCRKIYHKLKQDKKDILIYKVEGNIWEVSIADSDNHYTARHEFIHVALINAAIQTIKRKTDVEIPEKELNTKCRDWFSDLLDEYQIHLVSNNLDERIKNAKPSKKSDYQDTVKMV